MPEEVITAQYLSKLFLNDTPFLDVRSEFEYSKGNIPNSQNLPILNDHERHLVGTCYKQKGKQAAIDLGHQLVNGETKQRKIKQWCNLITTNPSTHIFCWRGGMRSRITQQWIRECGIHAPIIEGGYKALRQVLTKVIDDAACNLSLIRIGGKTGTAKTQLLSQITPSIDLEKFAAHRGSSFGKTIIPQPSQANFEHQLAIDLLKAINISSTNTTLFVEDESRNIGSVAIPENFYLTMRRSPLILIDMPIEFRIQRILSVYISDMLIDFQSKYHEEGFDFFCDYLQQSLFRIRKRLGLERYQRLQELQQNALITQRLTGKIDPHREWLMQLLIEYYDPMYEYQLKKNTTPILFRGNYDEVIGWLNKQSRTN